MMLHLFKAASQYYANGTFGTIYLVVLTAVGHVMRQHRLFFRVLGIPLTKVSPLGTTSCPILMYFLHRYAYEYEVVHGAYPL